jgi:hypothetical protein
MNTEESGGMANGKWGGTRRNSTEREGWGEKGRTGEERKESCKSTIERSGREYGRPRGGGGRGGIKRAMGEHSRINC